MPVKILIAVLLSMLILKAKTNTADNNAAPFTEKEQSGSTTANTLCGLQPEATFIAFYNRDLGIYPNIAEEEPSKGIVQK